MTNTYTDEWGTWEITGPHSRILIPGTETAEFEEKRVSAAATPPNPNGFLEALFAPPQQGGLGKSKARQLARDYPDVTLSLDRGRFDITTSAVEDMLTNGDITQAERDTIYTLADHFNIPLNESE